MTNITLVTGTYNRLPYLTRMMDSARVSVPTGIALDFVIVDGGSTDGTLDFLRNQPDVTLIEHGELLGAKKAFCDGAKVATGEYVLIANDDIRFLGDSILRALVYIENTPSCGGVAFAANHRFPNGMIDNQYRVQVHAAMVKGRSLAIPYAQVGLFPRWLGNEVGWWGDDDPQFTATGYGCDNYLSARIQERGYTIDAVQGVAVHDEFPEDILKAEMASANNHGFYARFPQGAIVPDTVSLRPDKRRLRILYLPIYEPGIAYDVQRQQKHGLRDALARYGRGQWVYEVDFVSTPNLLAHLMQVVETFKPDLVLSQLHGTDKLSASDIRALRSRMPRAVWVNWNGDVYLDHLVSRPMITLLREVDLQLVVNAAALVVYPREYIPAHYWQNSYEDPDGELPDMPTHEVVWLASLYGESRQAVAQALAEFNHHIYQPGDSDQTLYNFLKGKAIYQNAKIAIGTNEFPDAPGFVSNRFFQAVAAGGALLLHQHIPDFERLTGIVAGKHYVEWTDIPELQAKIRYYLTHEEERARIARAGTRYIRKHHSFDARVSALFDRLIHDAKRTPQVVARVRYVGPRSTMFGERGFEGRQYIVIPGTYIEIDPMDIPVFQRQPQLYEVVRPEQF